MTPHATARDALGALGWNAARTNPGPLADVASLQSLVAPAVRHAAAQMDGLLAAAKGDVERRVAQWARRLDRWDEEADVLIQRRELRQIRGTVRHEQELVAAMNPDRQLVRPLLVVIPDGGGRR